MIHDGILKALAPPDELKHTALRGTLLNVVCGAPFEAVTRLDGLPGVRDVALHGTDVHVLLDSDAWTADELVAQLTQAGIAVRAIRPIQPTIEDVFISLIGTRPSTAGDEA